MNIKVILTLTIFASLLLISCSDDETKRESNMIKFTTSLETMEFEGIYINWVYRFYYLVPTPEGSYIDVEERTYVITDGAYIVGKNKTEIDSYKNATFLVLMLLKYPSTEVFNSGIYTDTNPTTGKVGFFNIFKLSTPNQFVPESPTIIPITFKNNVIEINFEGNIKYYEIGEPKYLDATLLIKGKVSDIRNQ